MTNDFNSDQVTCRACLTQKRNLRSIFLKEKDCTYAEIIEFIANVKITAGDGHSDKICGICRKKSIEAFEFKNTVQQSQNFLEELKSNSILLKLDNFSENDFKNDTTKSVNTLKIETNDFKFEPSNDEATISNEKLSTVVLNEISNNEFLKDEVPECDYDTREEDCFNDSDDSTCGDEYLSAAINSMPCANKTKPKISFEKKINYSKDEDYIPYYKKPAKKNSKSVQPKRKVKNTTNPADKLSIGENSATEVQIKPTDAENCTVTTTSYSKNLLRKKKMREDKRALRNSRREEDNKRICPYCGRILKSKVTFSSHLLVHEGLKKYKCTECPKQFYTKGGLKNHEAIHSGEKSFHCDKCPMKFYTNSNLRSHLQSHMDVRKFFCQICSKGFKLNTTLRRHVLRHSYANKNVKCELCNMSFYEPDQLKNHMRIHTGERPFKCELCSQPYSYKRDFNRHCFNKHGVFMKWRDVRVMNKQVLEQERIDVRALIESTPEIELPTPAKKHPCIVDSAQVNRLFQISS